ncbi:transglycosylase family protein [Staphylococcus xylosus]|uniref:Transglycosylase n=1 Tax=Staphylococcus xylosus TaxID=1288 RepID=A0AAQ0LWI3_STAXY|nr:transglycosylase family protein [Staphylococcus xylosus]MCM3519647.1 transglycosylase family protein [Staphylococcus xylosus]PKI05151.1 transglycosylase [Staphylococcus xylosus]PTI00279.1 transglycosylase [Staphylococcus xylosus]PTI02501.1 transglycosylase [Staphylococcus xylosus]RIM65362.1 transglycosylase [Staphylococcus xylosus]
MKKTILASSLAVALGVTGYATTADHNQAHASEENIDKAHLADLAQNNPEELNQKPLHAGAYNYNFVLGGNEYTFTSNGQSWSWNYTAAGAQSATSNSVQDVTTQATTNTNETSASEVSAQKQSSNTPVAAVEAPKASSNTSVQTAQTSTASKASTTDTSSIDAIANQMAERTGVSAAQWKGVIQRESGGNAHAVNSSSGAYGLFQLLGHGEHAGMSVEDQMDAAVGVYQSQGAGAWVAW